MTTESWTPTDEDVETLARVRYEQKSDEAGFTTPWSEAGPYSRAAWLNDAREALAKVGPIIERERRAAKVEALREAASLLRDENPHPADMADAYANRIDYRADEIEREVSR